MARFKPAALVLAAALALGAAACGNGPVSPRVVANRTLTTDGGRVDWCAANNRIAFDRVTAPGQMDVYTILPDGTGLQCVTCSNPGSMPVGVRGQPAWHPSCAFLVIQVQGSFYSGNRFQFVTWGIDNDLWVVRADGLVAQRLVTVGECAGSLHPQFSDSGDRLFWAVRQRTNVPISASEPTPCDENPWDGWHPAVANFAWPPPWNLLRPASLAGQVDLYQGEGGFFETHALVGNTIWFSHTPAGLPYVDDSYTAAADGTGRANITRSTPTWDEHAQPSPGGRAVAFNSSRGFPWSHPPDLVDTLRLELWATLDGGAPVRLTKLNASSALSRTRVLTSDFAWGPSGQEIVLYHADVSGSATTQVIEILTLDQAY